MLPQIHTRPVGKENVSGLGLEDGSKARLHSCKGVCTYIVSYGELTENGKQNE